MPPSATTFYKRSNFVTHLPVERLYTPAHFWLAEEESGSGRWKIGFTKFATRMLGEIVEVQWEAAVGGPVQSGQIIGSIEGFKAISDLYCAAEGSFLGGNPALVQSPALVAEDPYGDGWLYAIEGKPDVKCINLESYRLLLDTTIDRILEKEGHEEEE